MAVLKAKARAKSAVIKQGGENKYPIPDKAHAKAALGRINQGNLSPAQKAKVRAKANSVLKKGK